MEATARGFEAAPPFEAPALGEAQQRVVNGLRENGIAVVRFEDLFDDQDWAKLQADIAPFVEQGNDLLRTVGARPKTKEEFILRRFRKHSKVMPRFSLDNPWLRIGLSDPMLDIANGYREQWTTLYYVDNWFTLPYAAADERIASQRWHRDPEEEHVLKVFLYLSDVDEDAGPFEYVAGSPTGGRYGRLWPWKEKDHHPAEEDLYRAVEPEDVLTLTGPAGTMIFCVTGGFHRGGFARRKPRILSIWTYLSTSAERGHRFELEPREATADLSVKVRAALR
jgi:Phytanoyl-CoA dioxygenase (PhyH)